VWADINTVSWRVPTQQVNVFRNERSANELVIGVTEIILHVLAHMAGWRYIDTTNTINTSSSTTRNSQKILNTLSTSTCLYSTCTVPVQYLYIYSNNSPQNRPPCTAAHHSTTTEETTGMRDTAHLNVFLRGRKEGRNVVLKTTGGTNWPNTVSGRHCYRRPAKQGELQTFRDAVCFHALGIRTCTHTYVCDVCDVCDVCMWCMCVMYVCMYVCVCDVCMWCMYVCMYVCVCMYDL
jgi:hypothetical protein